MSNEYKIIRRCAAFQVYLQHSLISAEEIWTQLKQRSENLLSDRTRHAFNQWLTCLYGAINVCGVCGLVAINRSAESFRLSLQADTSFGTSTKKMNQVLSDAYLASSRCYVKALNRQLEGDHENGSLWVYAGEAYDHVTTREVEHIGTVEQLTFERNDQCGFCGRRALEDNKKRKLAATSGATEAVEIWSRALRQLHLSMACRGIHIVLKTYCACLYPGCGHSVQRAQHSMRMAGGEGSGICGASLGDRGLQAAAGCVAAVCHLPATRCRCDDADHERR